MESAVHKVDTGERVISVAFLTREDLTTYNSNREIGSINHYHFRSAVLRRDDVYKCDLIIFRDNGRSKVLKSRF